MRKSTKKSTLLILLFAVTSVMFGCHGNSNPSDPDQGFTVKGVASVYNLQGTNHIDYATGGRFQGLFLSGAGTYGTVTSFDVNESLFSHTARGSKVPGTWRLGLSRGFNAGSLCVGSVVDDRNVSLGSVETLRCFGGIKYFRISTRFGGCL